MKEIVELMINGDDIYYFNLQKENFIKSFRYQNFEDALASLEQQKFDLEYQLIKINVTQEPMRKDIVQYLLFHVILQKYLVH